MISSDIRVSKGSLFLIAAIVVSGGLGVLGWAMVSVEVPRTPYVVSHEFPGGLQDSSVGVGVALEAPLFWESRLPVAVVEAEPENTVETLEGVELVGIVGSTALLKKADVVKRVLLGAKFDGFILESIEGNKILLVSSGRKVEMKMLKEPPTGVVLKPLR